MKNLKNDPILSHAMTVLRTLSPANLKARTNATWAMMVDFEAVWYGHTPEAARLMLLPYFLRQDLIVNESQ